MSEKSTQSPARDKSLIKNLGGMPPKKTAAEILDSNTPPARAPQPPPIDNERV